VLSEVTPVRLAGFQPGSQLAGYRLEALVATGGMAVVFRARDVRLDRLVALKILDPVRAADPAFRRRFFAESRAAAKVDDPHIIPVYEADEADGTLFIAMRFVDGGDLQRVLERDGALSPARAAGFISPVASALDAAHAAGLVHRDVKPANILVDAREGRPDHVYLSDFGIAKAGVSTIGLTGPAFIGTANYASPEQIDGKAVDGRADQYALACVAYRLLTGRPPYERDNDLAVMLAHLSTSPPSLLARRPDLPGAADQVLAKAMAKSPDQRYQSCGEFADALREALGVTPYRASEPAAAKPAGQEDRTGTVTIPQLEAGPPVTARRGRVWWMAGVGACVAIIAVVIAGAVILSTRNPAAPAAHRNQPSPAFPGYPGERGTVTVTSMASAGGTQEAVGDADGRPAIWRSKPGGAWTLVRSAAGPLPGGQTLTGVARAGSAGWLAIGDAVAGSGQPPFTMSSADGVTWLRPVSLPSVTGTGSYVTAAAAGPAGYVVAGEQTSQGRTFAGMWWSAGSRNWVLGYNGGLDGSKRPSTVYAVAATPGGFVAAGTHDTDGGIWTSPDGRSWREQDMAPPLGASSLVLRQLAVSGSRVVVAGSAVTIAGDIPFIAVSSDGGQHWSQAALNAPGGLGAVTALTASGAGFVAAGQLGPANSQRTVTWTSRDGLNWSAPATAGSGAGQITALTASGGTVTGAVQRGAGSYVITLP
jgi:Protein kinase domain